jgi:hypothetical protein
MHEALGYAASLVALLSCRLHERSPFIAVRNDSDMFVFNREEFLYEWQWQQTPRCNVRHWSSHGMQQLLARKSVVLIGDSHIRYDGCSSITACGEKDFAKSYSAVAAVQGSNVLYNVGFSIVRWRSNLEVGIAKAV